MKLFNKYTIWFLFFCLLISNVFIFIQGIKLGDEINYYEKEIKVLKKENIKLEKKLYMADSITNTASLAAELDFSDDNVPLYLTKPEYAYNR